MMDLMRSARTLLRLHVLCIHSGSVFIGGAFVLGNMSGESILLKLIHLNFDRQEWTKTVVTLYIKILVPEI